jgi:hypothetical protein
MPLFAPRPMTPDFRFPGERAASGLLVTFIELLELWAIVEHRYQHRGDTRQIHVIPTRRNGAE